MSIAGEGDWWGGERDVRKRRRRGRGRGHTHEQVVCLWHIPANTEEFHQVVELAMDVATDGDGCIDDLDI